MRRTNTAQTAHSPQGGHLREVLEDLGALGLVIGGGGGGEGEASHQDVRDGLHGFREQRYEKIRNITVYIYSNI